jgi:large subunit ribosomal protein L4
MEFDIFTLSGKKDKKVKFKFAPVENANLEHIYYLVDKYQKAYVRQGTQSTKTRSEVRGGGAKPYKQKGTGRARRGTQRTPLRPGGGIIFGPKPRSFKIKLNQNLFSIAFSNAFKAKQNEIAVVKSEDKALKTKDFAALVSSINSSNPKKILVIATNTDENLFLASRNVKGVTVCDPTFIPLQELLSGDQVIISDSALTQIEEMYVK